MDQFEVRVNDRRLAGTHQFLEIANRLILAARAEGENRSAESRHLSVRSRRIQRDDPVKEHVGGWVTRLARDLGGEGDGKWGASVGRKRVSHPRPYLSSLGAVALEQFRPAECHRYAGSLWPLHVHGQQDPVA